MAISDVQLSEFAQFSYFKLYKELNQTLNQKGKISIKEVADYYIENPRFYFKNITEINGVNVPTETTNNINDGVDYQWDLLKNIAVMNILM